MLLNFVVFFLLSSVRSNGRRRRHWRGAAAAEYLHGGGEIGAIEVLNERNDVATNGAASTVPDLLFDVDRKSVVTATPRARSAALNATAELDVTPFKFALERDVARSSNKVGADHGRISNGAAAQARRMNTGTDRLWPPGSTDYDPVRADRSNTAIRRCFILAAGADN